MKVNKATFIIVLSAFLLPVCLAWPFGRIRHSRDSLNSWQSRRIIKKLAHEDSFRGGAETFGGWYLQLTQKCGQELVCLPGSAPSSLHLKRSSGGNAEDQWWTAEDFLWFQTFMQVLDGLRLRHEKFIRLSHRRMGAFRDQLDTYFETTADIQHLMEMDLSFRRALTDGRRLAQLLSEKGHKLMQFASMGSVDALGNPEVCYNSDSESHLSYILGDRFPTCSVNASFEEIFADEIKGEGEELQTIVLDTLCLFLFATYFKSVYAVVSVASLLRLMGGVANIFQHVISVIKFAEDGNIDVAEFFEHYQDFMNLLEFSTSGESSWGKKLWMRWIRKVFGVRLIWIFVVAVLLSICDSFVNFRTLLSELIHDLQIVFSGLRENVVRIGQGSPSAWYGSIRQKALHFCRDLYAHLRSLGMGMSNVLADLGEHDRISVHTYSPHGSVENKQQLRRKAKLSGSRDMAMSGRNYSERVPKSGDEPIDATRSRTRRVAAEGKKAAQRAEEDSLHRRRTRPQKRRTSLSASSTPKKDIVISTDEDDRLSSRVTRRMRASSAQQ